jgi:hypothetical protein
VGAVLMDFVDQLAFETEGYVLFRKALGRV